MLKNAFIICFLLLSFFSTKAQYLGGNGDGYAMGETNNVVLGTDEISLNTPTVTIYPNPSQIESGFTIDFRSAALWNWIEIYDVTGKLRYKAIVGSSGHMHINLTESGLTGGVYFLRLKNSNGRSAQRKLVLTE